MSLFRMYWRRTLKRPAIIMLWASIPFVFMSIYVAVFGSSGTPKPSALIIIDQDSTFVSKFFYDAFARGGLSNFISVKKASNLKEVEKLFRQGKASGALVIPKNFSKSLLLQERTELRLFTNPKHFISPQILKGIIEVMVTMGNGLLGAFSEPMGTIRKLSHSDADPSDDEIADISRKFYQVGKQMNGLASLASIEVKLVEKDTEETIGNNISAYFFPGLIVFALLSLSLSLEVRFLMDRIGRLNKLILASPKRPMLIVLNQRIYAIVFLYFIAIVCSIAGGLLWGIKPVGLLKANIMIIGVIIFIVGINGLIFSTARSRRAAAAVSSFVLTVLIMVGGGIMPVEIFPKTFQRISHLTPTGLANTGIVESITGREVSISIPLLLLYCFAFFIASIYTGKKILTKD